MHALTGICTACGHGQVAAYDGQDDTDMFRLRGEYWVIRFEGRECNVHHTKGLAYLARLLAAPGRELHALDLVDCTHEDCDGDAYTMAERARLSVTRAIRRAQQRIAACHPSLGRHLETTIRTGTYCAYVPDSRLRIVWDVDGHDQSGGMRST
jgi:hypothetical protein